MHKIIIYGTPWCQWCLRAKSFFEKNKIPFEWKDADIEENAEEAYRKSKQRGIPVIDIDGNIIVGFNEQKIKEILRL